MDEELVVLEAHPRRVKVRVRIHMSAASEANRRGWPGTLEARTVPERTTLSLGPDQWLVLSDQLAAEELIARCGVELAGVRHHAVDVSAALRCVTVRGAKAPVLLGMGAGLNWSTPCTRTRFAAISIVAHRKADDRFDLYYDRSVGDYLRQWLTHALRDPLLSEASQRTAP